MISRLKITFLLLLMLSGCTSMREFLGFSYARPEFSLKNIEIKNLTMNAVELIVVIRVKNPNSFDITLLKLDYKVSVSGVLLAEGLFDKKTKFRAEGIETVRLPLTVNSENARTLMNSMMKDRDTEIVSLITGTAVFDSPVGKIEHSFVDEEILGERKKK
jgi:LEA14-like dessication related protein